MIKTEHFHINFTILLKNTKKLRNSVSPWQQLRNTSCSQTHTQLVCSNYHAQAKSLASLCIRCVSLLVCLFFKAVNGLVDMSHDVLPKVISLTITTRSSSSNQISFRPAKRKTTSYQHAFFLRASRTWNSLPTIYTKIS